MKNLAFLFLLLPLFSFSNDYLKPILFSKEKEFIKEYDFHNIPESKDIQIKEGIIIVLVQLKK